MTPGREYTVSQSSTHILESQFPSISTVEQSLYRGLFRMCASCAERGSSSSSSSGSPEYPGALPPPRRPRCHPAALSCAAPHKPPRACMPLPLAVSHAAGSCRQTARATAQASMAPPQEWRVRVHCTPTTPRYVASERCQAQQLQASVMRHHASAIAHAFLTMAPL